jgi:catechol 2,3-dioxygenase-like lactoylglutathione lyase family enzyme
MAAPFLSLDYVYMPSRDVAADLRYFTDVLGAERVFAIDGMGTRVAMLRLADSPPYLLLADHVEGDTPILVYRVESLSAAMAELETRGWKRGRRLELPMGPACSFGAPGGQRLAIYEATRPTVVEHFAGQADF